MASLRNPLRWTAGSSVTLLDEWKQAGIDSVLAGPEVAAAVREKAKSVGLEVLDPARLPPGIRIVKGNRPGVKRRSGGDTFETGPTGMPWVDSNGWLIRLERERNPGVQIWIEADPQEGSQDLAIADAAAYGGRWVIAPRAPVSPLPAFFHQHADWDTLEPVAALAVVSSFDGPDEFLSHEVLNLSGRLHQPYRIIEKSKLGLLEGVQAVVYPDAAAPASALRQRLMQFVEQGGLLIAGPRWGAAGADNGEHPRYRVTRRARGRIAVAKEALSDPYLVANDVTSLLSHSNDLVRFWNAGAMGSFYTRSRDGSRAVVHILNYAEAPGRFPVSVWVKGSYRNARLWTSGSSASVEAIPVRDGIEMHLPAISRYAVLELQKKLATDERR